MGLRERKERERQARRRQIIDAARSLLFEKGLQSTSINRIAKRAELAVGTIYFYYASKEELFAELQEEGLERLMEEIQKAAAAEENPRERLRAMAMAYYDFSLEHKDYVDIINYFLSSPNFLLSAAFKRRVDRRMEMILAFIRDTIARGADEGVFRGSDGEGRAALLLAALHGLMQFRKFESTVFKGASHRTLYNRAVGHLLDGMAAGDICSHK